MKRKKRDLKMYRDVCETIGEMYVRFFGIKYETIVDILHNDSRHISDILHNDSRHISDKYKAVALGFGLFKSFINAQVNIPDNNL